MADPFASAIDVELRWRPLTDSEQLTADVLCGDASTVIRARFPGIDQQVAGGAVDPDVLTIVCANMVKRALIAPQDGVASQAQADGPFSLSQTFSNPMRNVYLSQEDLVLIIGYQPGAASHTYGNTTRNCEEGGYFSTIYVTGP